MLAQLMQDLQSPEMMAEAKKMMENPEWQKKMKAFTGDAEMKEKFKSIGEDMKDAGKRAKLEAKMEAMVKLGNDQLKNQAGKTMEDAMASMNDPAQKKKLEAVKNAYARAEAMA